MVISMLIVLAVSILLVVGLFIWTARKNNQASLLKPTDTKNRTSAPLTFV